MRRLIGAIIAIGMVLVCLFSMCIATKPIQPHDSYLIALKCWGLFLLMSIVISTLAVFTNAILSSLLFVFEIFIMMALDQSENNNEPT